MMRDKFYKLGYFAILISIFCGCCFIFSHFKKQSDLDGYFSEKLERCHYTLLHPCHRMITESFRDNAAEEWMKIKGQMLQDGYTRAEIEAMDSKAFKKTQKEFNSFDDQFWKDMEDRIVAPQS